MIEFRKGEFLGGDISGIISWDRDTTTVYNWYNNTVNERCYFLIVEVGGNIMTFSPSDIGLDYIPDKTNIIDDFYGLIWASERTLVFNSIEEMESYKYSIEGPYKDKIYEYICEEIEKEMFGEAVGMFRCICELEQDSDNNLYTEFTKIIEKLNVDRDLAFATMKQFLIEHYLLEVQELKKAKLN